MKKFFALLVFATFAAASAVQAQNVFTVVYATSDDGFVNVRSQPSNSGRVLTKLYQPIHGLGSGVLCGQKGNWCKVRVGNVTGWAYSKYVGRQNWFTGEGKTRLVAAKPNTPIYGEDYTGERGLPCFATVSKGTIIADEYQLDQDGKYYVLITAHDYLFIRKSDVQVVRVR